MGFEKGKQITIDELLNSISKPDWTLKGCFDDRIRELDISFTTACEVLGIQSRALKGILHGTQKNVDVTNLIKLADFLRIGKQDVFDLYLRGLNQNFEIHEAIEPEKVKFIKENFDLAALRKVGFIKDLNDYSSLESKITDFLGLNSILEYNPPKQQAAFSEGKIKPKNNLTRDLWLTTAVQLFKEVGNPNEYDRQALIDYFPEIRRYCTSVNLGLFNVIKQLYRLGVTVAYIPSFPSLHLRGATLSVNRKPCVVLTDYKGFYSTFWFSLIHELFHVIFDWEEIRTNRYHLSDSNSEQLTVAEKELEADEFAREYLFSRDKLKQVKSRIKDSHFINNYARLQHVHPSFIYTFNAFDLKDNREAWAIAKRNNPDITPLTDPLNNDWSNPKPLKDYVKPLRGRLYD